MPIGITGNITKSQLDQKLGSLPLNVRKSLDDAQRFKDYFDGVDDGYLTETFNYTQEEIELARGMLNELAKFNSISIDFFNAGKKLWGFGA